jgi:hypothetical protein
MRLGRLMIRECILRNFERISNANANANRSSRYAESRNNAATGTHVRSCVLQILPLLFPCNTPSLLLIARCFASPLLSLRSLYSHKLSLMRIDLRKFSISGLISPLGSLSSPGCWFAISVLPFLSASNTASRARCFLSAFVGSAPRSKHIFAASTLPQSTAQLKASPKCKPASRRGQRAERSSCNACSSIHSCSVGTTHASRSVICGVCTTK